MPARVYVSARIMLVMVCASYMTCERLGELQEVEQALQKHRKMRNGGDAVAERDIGGELRLSQLGGELRPSQLPASRLSPSKMEPDTARWYVHANAGQGVESGRSSRF
jgi:hypothetical protein